MTGVGRRSGTGSNPGRGGSLSEDSGVVLSNQTGVTGVWQWKELENQAGPASRGPKGHAKNLNHPRRAAGVLSKVRCASKDCF